LEINKTVIVASRWLLFYLTYIDDARSNTNQIDQSGYLRNKWKNANRIQVITVMCNKHR